MIIVTVGIPVIAILIAILGIIGLANTLISSIYAIFWAISMVGYALVGGYLGIKQLVFAISKKKVIGLVTCVLIIFSGLFFPYYIYSCVTTATGSLEKGIIVTVIFNGVLFGVYNFIVSVFWEDSGNLQTNFIIGTIMISVVALITIGIGIKTYSVVKRDIWENSEGIDTANKYILTEDVFPKVRSKSYAYKDTSNYESVKFPYWTGNAVYPFARFDKGETVYAVYGFYSNSSEKLYFEDKMLCTGIMTGDWEKCMLVSTEDQKIVGYIPMKYLQLVE